MKTAQYTVLVSGWAVKLTPCKPLVNPVEKTNKNKKKTLSHLITRQAEVLMRNHACITTETSHTGFVLVPLAFSDHSSFDMRGGGGAEKGDEETQQD